jgi:glycogen synthase
MTSTDVHRDPKKVPNISVVVNTDGRAAALRNVIDSFRHLDYPSFEVIAVCGPTSDGTRDTAQQYAARGWIKYIECPLRNISQSRNLGIKFASGEIVAFIDDDAIPEPEWLRQLAAAFDEIEVGGAGGAVFDHTGYNLQYTYAACDRLGNPILDTHEPAVENSYPFCERFSYVQGTNCAFRREYLIRIGGFDEEYEFYLDETDVCCRLTDSGIRIRRLSDAAVHHKYLPSHMRNEHRVTTVKYPVIKNKIYFSFVNNHGHHPFETILEDALRFVASMRADLEFHVRDGRLRPIDLDAFEDDAEAALQAGLARGMSRERRLQTASFFENNEVFKPFPRLLTNEGPRRTFVFLSQNYPSGQSGGNARHTHDIARAIAALGHTTHVLTRGVEYNRVDFEYGVWVHRIIPKTQLPRTLPDGTTIPEHIWNYSATQLEELYRISKMRRIDVVESVSWDCEGIAVVLDGWFSSAANIVTALSHWLDTHDHLRNDPNWMAQFGKPMLAIERYLFAHSPGIVSASRAIAQSISQRYGVNFPTGQIGYVPHGIADVALAPRRPVAVLSQGGSAADRSGRAAALFVGRLELRKGIDVLLDAAPIVLAGVPDAELWIAGDDALEIAPGVTARNRFEQSHRNDPVRRRVHFLGRVDEEELRWLYLHCAVFVSPSRFESFGLTFVEAMMFGKPCIGCRAGGIGEVIEDGITGVLVTPGDALELADALILVLQSEDIRARMGTRGRARYEEHFRSIAVARQRIRFLSNFMRVPVATEQIEVKGQWRVIEVGYGKTARLLGPDSEISVRASAKRLFVTFWKHDWSGIVEVRVNGADASRHDLYAKSGHYETIEVPCPGQELAHVTLRRIGESRAEAHHSEVIVANIEMSAQ